MILDPPPIYDHPYNGPLVEWVWKAPVVDDYCRKAGGQMERGQIIGCSFKLGGTCIIVLSEHIVKLMRRHETAHCNGWRH